ncbi:hypothetical protein HUG17_6618 [Dermatophagoides farinae]|uniref:Uncharacterized protein n=1 Tax=Dermatophagoides farinae TaxID=6954 RepID=A0A9D4SK30_DERFA|nr:hypothetical protein HUG17_6618 [Dermatophagoides farinae]
MQMEQLQLLVDGLGVNIFQISPPDLFHDIVEGTQIKNKIKQINWINGPVKVKEDFSLKGKGTQKNANGTTSIVYQNCLFNAYPFHFGHEKI